MFFYYLLIFAPIFYALYRVVARPLMTLIFYRKQGINCSFVPTLGPLAEFISSQKLEGDIFAASKKLAKKDPKAKGKAFAVGSNVILNLMDSKLIRELAFNDSHYRKPEVRLLKFFMGSGGLAGLLGDEHKRQRRILASLMTPEFLDSFMLPQIVNATRGGINRIIRGDLDKRILLPELEMVPGEIIGRLFFGEDINRYNCNGEPLTLALANLMGEIEETWKTPSYFLFGEKFVTKGFLPSHRKIITDARMFRNTCMEIIQDRKKAGPQSQKFLCDLLLDTQKSNDPETRLTDEQILDEFIVFLIPGYQNISIFLQTAFYLLGNETSFQNELRQEVNKMYAKATVVSMDTLNKMDLMTAFIKEVLRMYPPSGGNLPRVAIDDHNLAHLQVKKGTVVKVDPFFDNFHPSLYNEPQKFNPQRWLEKKELDDPYAFLPFFAGSRRCMGEHLVWLELKIIIGEFLAAFEDIKVHAGYKFESTIKRRYQPANDVEFNLRPVAAAMSG